MNWSNRSMLLRAVISFLATFKRARVSQANPKTWIESSGLLGQGFNPISGTPVSVCFARDWWFFCIVKSAWLVCCNAYPYWLRSYWLRLAQVCQLLLSDVFMRGSPNSVPQFIIRPFYIASFGISLSYRDWHYPLFRRCPGFQLEDSESRVDSRSDWRRYVPNLSKMRCYVTE